MTTAATFDCGPKSLRPKDTGFFPKGFFKVDMSYTCWKVLAFISVRKEGWSDSVPVLARRIAVSAKTVARGLHFLVSHGYLQSIQPVDNHTGRAALPTYRVSDELRQKLQSAYLNFNLFAYDMTAAQFKVFVFVSLCRQGWFGSLNSLAECLCMSVCTVQRSLQALLSKKLLVRMIARRADGSIAGITYKLHASNYEKLANGDFLPTSNNDKPLSFYLDLLNGQEQPITSEEWMALTELNYESAESAITHDENKEISKAAPAPELQSCQHNGPALSDADCSVCSYHSGAADVTAPGAVPAPAAVGAPATSMVAVTSSDPAPQSVLQSEQNVIPEIEFSEAFKKAVAEIEAERAEAAAHAQQEGPCLPAPAPQTVQPENDVPSQQSCPPESRDQKALNILSSMLSAAPADDQARIVRENRMLADMFPALDVQFDWFLSNSPDRSFRGSIFNAFKGCDRQLENYLNLNEAQARELFVRQHDASVVSDIGTRLYCSTAHTMQKKINAFNPALLGAGALDFMQSVLGCDNDGLRSALLQRFVGTHQINRHCSLLDVLLWIMVEYPDQAGELFNVRSEQFMKILLWLYHCSVTSYTRHLYLPSLSRLLLEAALMDYDLSRHVLEARSAITQQEGYIDPLEAAGIRRAFLSDDVEKRYLSRKNTAEQLYSCAYYLDLGLFTPDGEGRGSARFSGSTLQQFLLDQLASVTLLQRYMPLSADNNEDFPHDIGALTTEIESMLWLFFWPELLSRSKQKHGNLERDIYALARHMAENLAKMRFVRGDFPLKRYHLYGICRQYVERHCMSQQEKEHIWQQREAEENRLARIEQAFRDNRALQAKMADLCMMTGVGRQKLENMSPVLA